VTKGDGQDELFGEDFLKKLEYLHIVSRKVFSGASRAERRTRKIGAGVEFADHRPYAPGDDLRTLDWKLFARLEKLLVRLFEEEEDLHVYLLLDVSESMMLGRPPKVDYGRRVAAALAYIALANLDRAAVVGFAEGLKGRLPPARGKGQIHKVFRFLTALQPGGATDLKTSARTFVHQNPRRGVVVVISDLYDPEGAQDGLNFLRYNKFEPFVVHVHDPAELNPDVRGDLRLVDCETGETRDVTVTDRLVKRYREAYEEFRQELEEFCTARRIPYFQAPVDVPFDDLILRIFRGGGFLR
jgi:uncharacterized protein (DUF58 family)